MPVTYHEISSLGMENIGGCPYPQASLRRGNLPPASSPSPEERSPGHLILQRDGKDFHKLPNQVRGLSLSGDNPFHQVSLIITVNILGVIPLCLSVKAVDAKDGVSHVRPRPMCSQEVVNGTLVHLR